MYSTLDGSSETVANGKLNVDGVSSNLTDLLRFLTKSMQNVTNTENDPTVEDEVKSTVSILEHRLCEPDCMAETIYSEISSEVYGLWSVTSGISLKSFSDVSLKCRVRTAICVVLDRLLDGGESSTRDLVYLALIWLRSAIGWLELPNPEIFAAHTKANACLDKAQDMFEKFDEDADEYFPEEFENSIEFLVSLLLCRCRLALQCNDVQTATRHLSQTREALGMAKDASKSLVTRFLAFSLDAVARRIEHDNDFSGAKSLVSVANDVLNLFNRYNLDGYRAKILRSAACCYRNEGDNDSAEDCLRESIPLEPLDSGGRYASLVLLVKLVAAKHKYDADMDDLIAQMVRHPLAVEQHFSQTLSLLKSLAENEEAFLSTDEAFLRIASLCADDPDRCGRVHLARIVVRSDAILALLPVSEDPTVLSKLGAPASSSILRMHDRLIAATLDAVNDFQTHPFALSTSLTIISSIWEVASRCAKLHAFSWSRPLYEKILDLCVGQNPEMMIAAHSSLALLSLSMNEPSLAFQYSRMVLAKKPGELGTILVAFYACLDLHNHEDAEELIELIFAHKEFDAREAAIFGSECMRRGSDKLAVRTLLRLNKLNRASQTSSDVDMRLKFVLVGLKLARNILALLKRFHQGDKQVMIDVLDDSIVDMVELTNLVNSKHGRENGITVDEETLATLKWLKDYAFNQGIEEAQGDKQTQPSKAFDVVVGAGDVIGAVGDQQLIEKFLSRSLKLTENLQIVSPLEAHNGLMEERKLCCVFLSSLALHQTRKGANPEACHACLKHARGALKLAGQIAGGTTFIDGRNDKAFPLLCIMLFESLVLLERIGAKDVEGSDPIKYCKMLADIPTFTSKCWEVMAALAYKDGFVQAAKICLEAHLRHAKLASDVDVGKTLRVYHELAALTSKETKSTRVYLEAYEFFQLHWLDKLDGALKEMAFLGELEWFAVTAWNSGGNYYRSQKFVEAEAWMALGLTWAKHVPALEKEMAEGMPSAYASCVAKKAQSRGPAEGQKQPQ